MFNVLVNQRMAPNLHRMVVAAPRIARARKPGQFVIVRKEDGAERVPLTIADADAKAGTITLIIQAIGASTRNIVSVAEGGSLRDVVGPLGNATHLKKWGTVACIGGGVGTAVLYPLAKALAEAGNAVYSVIGARNKELVILADELAGFSKEVFVITEDGSAGRKGLVTHVLADMIAGTLPRPAAVFAVGPLPMMAAVVALTKPAGIETIVSLNPIMIDGTGMCGGCRVTVGGKTRFACVDGPEFNGLEVDFAELGNRLKMYRGHEQDAVCKLDALAREVR